MPERMPKRFERYTCTADDPWTPEKGDYARHPDAKILYAHDEYDTYRCPNCGAIIDVEIPQ